MKHIVLCFLILLLILLLSHYIHNKKIKKDYTVIQLNNPSKIILEENMKKKIL